MGHYTFWWCTKWLGPGLIGLILLLRCSSVRLTVVIPSHLVSYRWAQADKQKGTKEYNVGFTMS